MTCFVLFWQRISYEKKVDCTELSRTWLLLKTRDVNRFSENLKTKENPWTYRQDIILKDPWDKTGDNGGGQTQNQSKIKILNKNTKCKIILRCFLRQVQRVDYYFCKRCRRDTSFPEDFRADRLSKDDTEEGSDRNNTRKWFWFCDFALKGSTLFSFLHVILCRILTLGQTILSTSRCYERNFVVVTFPYPVFCNVYWLVIYIKCLVFTFRPYRP